MTGRLRVATGISEIDPNDADAYNQSRRCPYIIKGEYNKAIHVLRQGYRDKSEAMRFPTPMPRQYACEKAGDRQAAIQAYYALGGICERDGDYGGALDAYRKVVAIVPKFGRAYQNLGGVHKRMGDYDGAVAAYDNAVRFSPELEDEVYADIADVHKLRGDYGAAFRAFDELVKAGAGWANPYRMEGGRVVCALCDMLPYRDEAAASRVAKDAIEGGGTYLRAYYEGGCGHWHTTSDPVVRG